MEFSQPKIIVGVSGKSIATDSVRAMMAQLKNAGAVGLFLSHDALSAQEAAARDIDSIDALVVMGNDRDIAPENYLHRYEAGDAKAKRHPETISELECPLGTKRAEYEERMLQQALARKMPILGICGGMQRLNVMLGGTLHQHLPDLVGCNKHMQRDAGIPEHIAVLPILIKEETLLHAIVGQSQKSYIKTTQSNCPKVIMENSMHHQALDKIGDGLHVNAITDSVKRGKGEAAFLAMGIETDPEGKFAGQFIVGVQWHPEFGASSAGERICDALIHAVMHL